VESSEPRAEVTDDSVHPPRPDDPALSGASGWG